MWASHVAAVPHYSPYVFCLGSDVFDLFLLPFNLTGAYFNMMIRIREHGHPVPNLRAKVFSLSPFDMMSTVNFSDKSLNVKDIPLHP